VSKSFLLNLTGILTFIIIIFVLYELIEHIVFPLVWSIRVRNRNPLTGIESMIGKEVKVKKWEGTNGLVFVNGELWQATSDSQLLPGSKAIIDKVNGLLLYIKQYNDDCNSH